MRFVPNTPFGHLVGPFFHFVRCHASTRDTEQCHHGRCGSQCRKENTAAANTECGNCCQQAGCCQTTREGKDTTHHEPYRTDLDTPDQHSLQTDTRLVAGTIVRVIKTLLLMLLFVLFQNDLQDDFGDGPLDALVFPGGLLQIIQRRLDRTNHHVGFAVQRRNE